MVFGTPPSNEHKYYWDPQIKEAFVKVLLLFVVLFVVLFFVLLFCCVCCLLWFVVVCCVFVLCVFVGGGVMLASAVNIGHRINAYYLF